MAEGRILIVDDEPDFIQMIKIRLENEGYDVDSATDGQEGLKKARSFRPHLILLDILMPGKDGYTMIRELRLDGDIGDTPVIVTTAKTGMSDLFKVEGVVDYLVKPFDDGELISRIKKLIKK
jgi:DNA-binding response OmpR family regulator